MVDIELSIEERCKIIEDIFNKGLRFSNARAEKGKTWRDEIVLHLTKHQFHDWDELHVASFFERIYAKTKMIFVALTRFDDGISVTFYGTKIHRFCDYDGTEWKETKYKAKCPNCGETESFHGMTYDPDDYRNMICPKCKVVSRVQRFYSIVI